MSAVPNALQTLTSSSSRLSAFSEFSNPYDLASLGSGFLGNGLGLIGLSGAAGFITDAEHKVAGPETVSAPGPREGASHLSERATTVSAGLGRASSLGGVSVPEGWASAAPEVRLVAQASPLTSPVPTNGSSPGLFSGMPVFGGAPLMSLSGRGAADSRARRAGGKHDAPGVLVRAGGAAHHHVENSGGRGGGATAELREVTDLLGKLGRLRDGGVLTDKEFGEQKQRLLSDPSRWHLGVLDRPSRRRGYPALQRFAPNQLTAVSESQLLCSRSKFLIAHHDTSRASVMERTRNHLLDRSDANRLTVPLALNRHILAILLGDQVNSVVTDGRSEADLPACPLQACGDVVFEFHPVHGIYFPHAGIDPHSPRSRS
jgi:PPE-SVP subfamily C-terminal region